MRFEPDCLKSDQITLPAAMASMRSPMRADIHPKYSEVTVNCSCGNSFKTRSTLSEDLRLDVCSNCHPFYTGKHKILDTGGRVDKFNKRFVGTRKV
jgi:large subunit ribosomal protein L31